MANDKFNKDNVLSDLRILQRIARKIQKESILGEVSKVEDVAVFRNTMRKLQEINLGSFIQSQFKKFDEILDNILLHITSISEDGKGISYSTDTMNYVNDSLSIMRYKVCNGETKT